MATWKCSVSPYLEALWTPFFWAFNRGFIIFPDSSVGKCFITFPDSSVGKESACNAGDPSSIPGSGRFPGEGIGYPLQYSWASPVAQLVKNPPAMQETWVWSLGWEGPLEKGKATHSSILALGLKRVGHDWATFTFTSLILNWMSLYSVLEWNEIVKVCDFVASKFGKTF